MMADLGAQTSGTSAHALPPLPPGWTEHKAPTGHSYFYNAESKTSTYKRPGLPQQAPAPPPPPPQSFQPQPYQAQGLPAPYNFNNSFAYQGPTHVNNFGNSHAFHQNNHFQAPPRNSNFSFNPRPRYHEPQDRPKHRTDIPNCKPWVLVRTKLHRRFVHNVETGESFWKFPEEVMKAVVEFDRVERERKAIKEKGQKQDDEVADESKLDIQEADREEERLAAAELASRAPAADEDEDEDEDVGAATVPQQDDENRSLASDEEYEEVEVTDDEVEGTHSTLEPQAKRQRTSPPAPEPELELEPEDKPLEFTEDDIAHQLAAMGADYNLDPGEYGDEADYSDYEEGAEGLPLTDEDAVALFTDLLSDFRLSPFTTFDSIIADGAILDDPRYTALTSMRARREAWDAWSRTQIQELKAAREKMEKRDPRIPYLAFLAENASTKLYWPEFKRKYRKEGVMRETKMAEKEREKMYREHVSRLKLPSSQLKSDLSALLKSVSPRELNRDTSLEALPQQLLTDIRFYSVPVKQRDELVKTYISTLPPKPETGLSAEEEKEVAERKREREKRELALKERERAAEEKKRREYAALRVGKARVREGEREIESALGVGRRGLRSQLEGGADEGGEAGENMEE